MHLARAYVTGGRGLSHRRCFSKDFKLKSKYLLFCDPVKDLRAC